VSPVPASENVLVIPSDEHCSLAFRLAESNFKTGWSPNGFSIEGDIYADVDGITEFEAAVRFVTRNGTDKAPPLTFVKDAKPGVLHAKLSRVLPPSLFGAEAGDRTVLLTVESTRVWRNESKTLLDGAFRVDFERNGPSLFRLMQTMMRRWQRYRSDADPRVRARVQVAVSAWYHKQRPTFADSLAAVRRTIWSEQGFVMSRQSVETTKLPPALREGIAYALCHAA